MNRIRSRQHNIGTERINKTALSANDDKRIILKDGIRTLAIGHYRTERCVPTDPNGGRDVRNAIV